VLGRWKKTQLLLSKKSAATCVLIALFFLSCMLRYISFPVGTIPTASGVTRQLMDGSVIMQEISTEDPISRISFRVATFCVQLEDGTLELRITNRHDGTLADVHVWTHEEVLDNKILAMDTFLEAGDYTFEFLTSGIGADTPIALYKTTNIAEFGESTFDGTPQNHAVALEIRGSNLGMITPVPVAAILGFVVLFAAIMLSGCSTEKRFVLLSAVITVCMILLIRTAIPEGFKWTSYYATLMCLWVVLPIALLRSTVNDILKWLAERKSTWGLLALAFVIAAAMGVCLEIVLKKTDVFAWTRAMFFGSIVFVCATFVFLRKTLFQKPEQAFLLISLSLGLCICVTLPIASNISWDDQIHYSRVINCSQGMSAVFSGADTAISEITASKTLSVIGRDENANSLNALDKVNHVTHTYNRTFFPHNIGYYPSVVGIWLGRILTLDFSATYTLGRIGNLLAYVAMIYFGMKRLINGKIVLMILALFPTNLFLACSYSYDTWVTGGVALAVSYFLGAIQRPEENLTYKEAAIMMTAFFVGIMPKSIYFVAILLLLLMPRTKFPSLRSERRYQRAVCLTVLLGMEFCLFTILQPLVFSSTGLTDVRGGADVNAVKQVLYILTNPIEYMCTLVKFLKEYLSLEHSNQYISFWAYLGIVNLHTVATGMLWTAVATDCVEDEIKTRSWYTRVAAAAILFVTLCAAASSLYITFTPVAATTVAGFQPRYILPLLFPFYMLSCSGKHKYVVNRTCYHALFYAGSMYVCVMTYWYLVGSKVVS